MVRMIVIVGLVALSGCVVGDDDDDGSAPPATSVATAAEPTTGAPPSSGSAPPEPVSVCTTFEDCASACAEIELGPQTQTVRQDCLDLCPPPQFGMNEASLTQWGETCAGLFPPEGGSSSSGESPTGSSTGDADDTGTTGGTTGPVQARGSLGSFLGRRRSHDEPTCAEWTVACMAFEDAAQG